MMWSGRDGEALSSFEIAERASWAVRETGTRQREQAAVSGGWGLLPALSLAAAIGMFVLALADTGSRVGDAWGIGLYWVAIVAICVAIALRLFMRDCTRRERVGLVSVLGLYLYAPKILAWPLGFTFHDELGQLRTTLDISATHHLFSLNPIVHAYGYYPGTEIAANAIASVGGVDPTVAGFILVGATRVLFMIALFRLFEIAGSSARFAGIATLIYVANPSFVYFDSQVAYESLALPVVVLVLAAVARSSRRTNDSMRWRVRTGDWLVPIVCVAAAVVTHHVSVYFLSVALVAWAVLGRSRWLSAPPRGSWVVAAASVGAAAGWYGYAGRATKGELGSIPISALTSLWALATGSSSPRQLFHASNGTPEPLLQQLVGFAAVVLVLVVLPFGVRRVARQKNALSILLLGLAALYPVSLVLRLTDAGAETSGRASEFLFLGVGYVLACALTNDSPPRAMSRLVPVRAWFGKVVYRPALFGPAVFASYATLLIAGGIVDQWAPGVYLPGPYRVGDPVRSIEPQSVQTSRWAARTLAPATVIGDSTNSLLLAAYARMSPTTSFVDNVPLLDLYRSPALTSTDREMLLRTRYLVVDERLSTALPFTDYFGKYDYDYGLRRPLPLPSLRKFDHVSFLSRLYDSGSIAIYRREGA